MANVNIKFNGKEFLLSCDDGQEEHLEQLSDELNKKFNKLKLQLGNIGESKLLLITSIQIFDEFFETRKNINNSKNEIESLKNKFKELKSLVYNYKIEKEQEIKKLNDEMINLKKEMDENSKNYNQLIDNTTNQILQFIKSNSDTSVQ